LIIEEVVCWTRLRTPQGGVFTKGRQLFAAPSPSATNDE
jgi:hypothetical protein